MQRGDKPVLGKRPSTDKTLSQRLTTGVFHGIPAYLCAVVLLLVVLVGSVLFAVTVGSADLTVRQVYEVILFEWFHIGDPATLAQGAAHDIVWYIRLPRIVLGVAVGMGLATVGVVMQAVVQNPLADPYILGISSGASLGATAAILLGIGAFGSNSVGVCAFLGALGVSFAVIGLSHLGGRATPVKLVLAGVALSSVCSAISNFIVYVADDPGRFMTVTFWLMGSLAGAEWESNGVIFFGCASGNRLFLDAEPHAQSHAAGGRYGYHAGDQFAPLPASVSGGGLAGGRLRCLCIGRHRICRVDDPSCNPRAVRRGSSEAVAPVRSGGRHLPGLGRRGGPDDPSKCGVADWNPDFDCGGAGVCPAACQKDLSVWREAVMRIDAEGLSFSWGSTQILKDISLRAENGCFVGLIGPNGSGKSTFLKCIYRVLQPKMGCIRLDGEPLSHMSHKEAAKRLGVVAQHNAYDFDFLVKDMVLMGRAPHKRAMDRDTAEDYAIMREALKQVGMEALENRPFSSLSGGEQQRVILARALAQRTEALILDEPTNHLDIKYQLQLLNIVKSMHKTVLSAFHDLNLAAMYSDVIYVVKDGQIYSRGTPREVLTEQMIEEVYGVRAKVRTDEDGQLLIIYQAK